MQVRPIKHATCEAHGLYQAKTVLANLMDSSHSVVQVAQIRYLQQMSKLDDLQTDHFIPCAHTQGINKYNVGGGGITRIPVTQKLEKVRGQSCTEIHAIVQLQSMISNQRLSTSVTLSFTHTHTNNTMCTYCAPCYLHSMSSEISTQSELAHIVFHHRGLANLAPAASDGIFIMYMPVCTIQSIVKRAVKGHTLQL